MVVIQPQPQKRPAASVASAAGGAALPIHVCDFSVAVDTREQQPFTFSNIIIAGKQWIIKREVKTLQTADYSIVGFEDRIVVERKSPEDFMGSIAAGNARFRREHERMQAIIESAPGNFAAIVIEGNMAAMCDEVDNPNSGRRMTSETIIGITASWPRRFGVHLFFAGDRRRAELLTFRILLKWYQENVETRKEKR